MSNTFPKLLVSVRDADEALDAIAGGADWIDLKEPLAGALGAVSADVARDVTAKLYGRAPLSAAFGELVDWQKSNAKQLLAVDGIDVVKLGLAKCTGTDWRRQWLNVFAEARAASKQLAAVIYADWREAEAPSPGEVLQCAKQAGGEYLLIDTWNKSGPSTLQIMPVKNLCKILLAARNHGIKTVLAGKISLNDLSLVASLPINILAVRGAVCPAGRESRLESRLVKRIRHLSCSSTTMQSVDCS